MTVKQEIEEIDVVQLTEAAGHWPAGAKGTVVIDFGEDKMLEMASANEVRSICPLSIETS